MTPSPAYSDGYLACRAGTPLSRNPFADTPRSFHPAHDDWRRGWLKAEADIDAENVERQFREPKQCRHPHTHWQNHGFGGQRYCSTCSQHVPDEWSAREPRP